MSLRHAALAAVVVLATTLPTANAAEPVLIARTVGTALNVPAMKDCPWGDEMAMAIVKASKGAAQTTELAPAAVPGRYLALEVIAMRSPGGGGFSGPKWIRVRGDLLEGGKVVTTFELQRQSHAGKGSACGTARYLSTAMAESVAGWIAANGSRPAADLQTTVPTAAEPAAAPAADGAPAAAAEAETN